jgi:hypothetical protein
MKRTSLASKYKKFEEDTSLMLWVLWDTENYKEIDAELLNDYFIVNYFSSSEMRENLKVVDGKCRNSNGADVREVAKNYIEHFKLITNIKSLL